ncbi:MAG: hypothetical protein H5T86_10050 [Armatimonadetes bacterium]|nr:hypothetical protein [Armatimonadota bacterium]
MRALLQVEHGLEKTNAPVLYGVFGRGHVLEPFVGAAITLDNALQLIAYMNGPCTCELKAANPGMDLLTSVNWAERTAAAAPVRDRPEPSFIMGFVGESGYAEFELRPAQEGEGMSPGTESPTGFGQPTSTSVPPPGTPSPAELNRPDLELNTIGGEAGRNRLSTAEPSQATVRPKSASPGPAGPAEVDRPKKPAVPSVPASPPVRESSLAAQGIANAEVGTDTELQLLAINRPPDAPAPEAEAARSQLIPLVGLSLAFLAIIALAGGTVMLLRRSGAHR